MEARVRALKWGPEGEIGTLLSLDGGRVEGCFGAEAFGIMKCNFDSQLKMFLVETIQPILCIFIGLIFNMAMQIVMAKNLHLMN